MVPVCVCGGGGGNSLVSRSFPKEEGPETVKNMATDL